MSVCVCLCVGVCVCVSVLLVVEDDGHQSLYDQREYVTES